MIGYLEGKLLKKETDRILLLVNHVGYEILLPAFIMDSVKTAVIGDELSFYIYHQQTERQPKPILIGFNVEAEKEFFQLFISVEDIGPLKAVKAMSMSVRDIARAIAAKDVKRLRGLKGIGERTANKIIATLFGKVDKYAIIREMDAANDAAMNGNHIEQVNDVLINQLGYKTQEADKMIAAALERNPSISNAEDLFDEVYRGEKKTT